MAVSLELEKAVGDPVMGIDEAGRGPLAGGVYAAAVSVPLALAEQLLVGAWSEINDSKKLTEKKRERLAAVIKSTDGCRWAVASASPKEIDELNILNATHLAMRRAADEVGAEHVLVDGLPVKTLPHAVNVVKGDAKSLLIAAASILAKTARDADCLRLEALYPGYGFAKHKGYPTKDHMEALSRLGPCPEQGTSMKNTIPMLCAALFALAAFAKTSTPEGWLDDYDAALKKAAAENKHGVIDFSGSDWCGWCKRLDKEVFATDEFRKGAAEKYVLLMVDSPSDKSLLTPEAAKNNPKLVEKFGIEGYPTVVVLDSKGEEVLRTGYQAGGPEKYLKMLDEEIRFAPEIKKYIKPIEDVLNRHDEQMRKDSDAAMEKVKAKFPRPDKKMSKSERQKYQQDAMGYMQKIMFEEVYPKYVPLIEKCFAEAKAMKVPEALEERKKELIEGEEKRFDMLRKALKEHAEKKSEK